MNFSQKMAFSCSLDPMYITKEECEVYSLCFPKDMQKHNFLLVGTASGTISFWNLKTLRKEKSQVVGSDAIMQLTSYEDKILSQDKSGSLCVWNIEGYSLQLENRVHMKYIGYCKFDVCSSDRVLVSAGENSTVEILSPPQLSKSMVIQRSGMDKKIGMVMALKIFVANSSMHLLVAYENEELAVFELKDQKEIDVTRLGFCSTTIEFDENTMQGACAGVSDKIVVFTILQPAMKINILGHIVVTNAGIACLKLHPCKCHLISSGWDGHIRVFTWKAMRPVVVLPEHFATVNVIDFSQISKLMAVGSDDKRVSLWCLPLHKRPCQRKDKEVLKVI